MPAEEGQPDDQPRVTGQVPPPAPTTGLEQILPGRPPLPHAEEKGAFFVYQRELAPGTRLEQYEIIRVLGSGGFGITYLAKDLFLNRNVVIKENFPSRYSYRDPLTGHIRPNNEHDLENYTWALKSFLSEAQTLAELNNPGIVRILSVFEANGTAYFAMEHITGLSLDYLGEKLHSTGHRYTEDELKGLLTRLLRILDYLHSRHIYHRDIKPGNILLTEEGTPVLIDFGAARHALKLHAATVLTTQGYSSPEQALGKTNIGPWSDLYSVGATFYALLTGNPPDRAEARLAEDEMQPLHSDPVLTRYYSRQFLLSLDKALAPQINCRYQTAGEWIHDICAISGEESSATIQVLPADLRHAHPEGMPTPGAGKHRQQKGRHRNGRSSFRLTQAVRTRSSPQPPHDVPSGRKRMHHPAGSGSILSAGLHEKSPYGHYHQYHQGSHPAARGKLQRGRTGTAATGSGIHPHSGTQNNGRRGAGTAVADGVPFAP